MEKRFRVLRFLGLLYKILAWIVLVLGILAAIATVVIGATADEMLTVPGLPVVPMVGGLGILLGTVFYFVLLYAVGELIHLGLAIEENTRETAYYLRGEATIPPPPEPVR
ncbi:MAG TPA: hypothetical protein GX714_04595 [Chloroflexi bacterium]|jgi:hypothetical protein|nr:hypothetical protein [Chloroflexota bacterium]